MMKNTVYLSLLLFTLSGCIEPYDAPTGSIDSILVVEGTITSGTTQINLSKSVDVHDNLWNYMWGGNEDQLYVNDALVYVESEDGTPSETAHSSGSGKYLIETGELNANTKYRLAIHLDNEVYHSEFITPAISPPMELSYRINYFYSIVDKDTIKTVNNTDVFVSTQGYENQPGYYLWSYREDWEIHALIRAPFNPDPDYIPPPYDCWGRDSSRVFLLGSTEKLIENTIRDYQLLNIYSQNIRVSSKYRIQVRQNVIHKDAYDYFNNQKKNSEQTGSIFGVIPSELMGNIKCTSNPDIPVIGYVDVSTTSVDELYLTSEECYDPTYESSQRLSCYEAESPSLYCFDCTYRGGTTKRPNDWQ